MHGAAWVLKRLVWLLCMCNVHTFGCLNDWYVWPYRDLNGLYDQFGKQSHTLFCDPDAPIPYLFLSYACVHKRKLIVHSDSGGDVGGGGYDGYDDDVGEDSGDGGGDDDDDDVGNTRWVLLSSSIPGLPSRYTSPLPPLHPLEISQSHNLLQGKQRTEENVFQLWIYCPGPRPHLLFQTDSISGPIGVICALGNPPTGVASKRTSWQFSKLYILVRNISSELPCTPALMIDKVHRWIVRQCEQFLGNNCERGGQWTDHMWKHKSLSLF